MESFELPVDRFSLTRDLSLNFHAARRSYYGGCLRMFGEMKIQWFLVEGEHEVVKTCFLQFRISKCLTERKKKVENKDINFNSSLIQLQPITRNNKSIKKSGKKPGKRYENWYKPAPVDPFPRGGLSQSDGRVHAFLYHAQIPPYRTHFEICCCSESIHTGL